MIPYCSVTSVMCSHILTESCPRLFTEHAPGYPECKRAGEKIKGENKYQKPLTSVRCPKCLKLTIVREQDINGEFTLGFCTKCDWHGKLLNTVKL